MKLLKQLLFTFLSIFLLHRTIELLTFLHFHNPSNFSFLEISIQGFLILFAIVSFINLIENMYPVVLQPCHRMRIQRIAKEIQ